VLIDRSTALSPRVIGYAAAAMTIVTGPRGGGRRAEERSGDAAVRRSAGAPLLTVIFLATHRMLRAGVLPRVGPPAATGAGGWLARRPDNDIGEIVRIATVVYNDPSRLDGQR
jgi:hypothetical protein